MLYRICLLVHCLIFASTGFCQKTIILDNPINGKDYSEVLNCHFDQSQCTKKASDTEVQVILKSGEWIVDSTVTLTYRDQLVLEYGASIVRSKCNTQEPILHLKGKYSAIIGKSKNLVKSNCNNLTNGIIKVGHTTSYSKGNIISCQIQNLIIQGPTSKAPSKGNDYDNSAFDQITGIYIYNNQNEPNQKLLTANYYHTIRDVDLSFVSTGIHFYNSTACTLDNILLNRVGIHGGHGILIEGGQENKLSNIHHGFSPNANSLSFVTSTESYPPAYNTVVNYVVEIGKTSGDLARINSGGHCLNIDVNPKEFYNNDINISCNHPTSPLLQRGMTIKDYQTPKNRSVIR